MLVHLMRSSISALPRSPLPCRLLRFSAMSAHTMSPRSFLRYLLPPAQPVGLLFIAVLTLGFALCSAAGLFGLPILVILLSWLSKYAYVLLEQVAHGAREPPVLAIEMVNPAADFRPLVQRSEEHTSELQSLRHLVS